MKFATEIAVRFAHVDPAGIVFYPRYFEMFNQVVEEWFADLGFDFRTIHLVRGEGVPAVHVEADFHRASRLGDSLRFELMVDRLGRSTIGLGITAWCGDEHRLTARLVLTYARLEPLGSLSLPEEIRARMINYQNNEILVSA